MVEGVRFDDVGQVKGELERVRGAGHALEVPQVGVEAAPQGLGDLAVPRPQQEAAALAVVVLPTWRGPVRKTI